jgi:hypothetical protein
MYRVRTYDKDGKLIQTYCSYNRSTLEAYVSSSLDKVKGIKHIKSWEEDRENG